MPMRRPSRPLCRRLAFPIPIDDVKIEALKESLKNFGGKLLLLSKAHYEKVILGVVLLGLLTMVVLEFLSMRSVRAELATDPMALVNRFGGGKAKPIEFTNQAELLRMAKEPVPFDLSKGHYVFNPRTWKMYSNILIHVRSGKEFGIGALIITNIARVELKLTAKVSGTEDRPNYSIQGSDELLPPFPLGHKIQRSLVVTSTPVKIAEQFGVPQNTVSVILHGAKGDFESQSVSLDMELRYGGETNRVRLLQNKTNSYLRGYTASMVYTPANRTELNVPFPRKRVGTQIHLDGEVYTIMEMTEGKVVFSHDSTGKQIEVPLLGFRGRL